MQHFREFTTTEHDAALDRESPTVGRAVDIDVNPAERRQFAEELCTEFAAHVVEWQPQRPKPLQPALLCQTLYQAIRRRMSDEDAQDRQIGEQVDLGMKRRRRRRFHLGVEIQSKVRQSWQRGQALVEVRIGVRSSKAQHLQLSHPRKKTARQEQRPVPTIDAQLLQIRNGLQGADKFRSLLCMACGYVQVLDVRQKLQLRQGRAVLPGEPCQLRQVREWHGTGLLVRLQSWSERQRLQLRHREDAIQCGSDVRRPQIHHFQRRQSVQILEDAGEVCFLRVDFGKRKPVQECKTSQGVPVSQLQFPVVCTVECQGPKIRGVRMDRLPVYLQRVSEDKATERSPGARDEHHRKASGPAGPRVLSVSSECRR